MCRGKSADVKSPVPVAVDSMSVQDKCIKKIEISVAIAAIPKSLGNV